MQAAWADRSVCATRSPRRINCRSTSTTVEYRAAAIRCTSSNSSCGNTRKPESRASPTPLCGAYCMTRCPPTQHWPARGQQHRWKRSHLLVLVTCQQNRTAACRPFLTADAIRRHHIRRHTLHMACPIGCWTRVRLPCDPTEAFTLFPQCIRRHVQQDAWCWHQTCPLYWTSCKVK